MNEFNKMLALSRKESKDVKAGKLMYCSRAFERYTYLICDLLGVPPDAALTPEQWEAQIKRADKKLNR